MTIAETAKKNPWKVVLTALTVVPSLIAIIYFTIDVGKTIVTQGDLLEAKTEIINELRNESAAIRVAILRDLEARLEDVEIQMETLDQQGKPIPESLRRSAKRLQRRIEEVSQ